MKIGISIISALCLVSLTTLAPVNMPAEQEAEVQAVAQAAPQGPPLVQGAPGKGEVRYTPFNAVEIAHVDAVALATLNSPDLQPEHVRYLSLHNIPEAKRAAAKEVLDRILNGLNPSYRRIVRTAGLPAGSPAPVVLRVNLQDYNIRTKSWDYLAENGSGQVPIPDPYFHEFISANDVATVVTGTPAIAVTYAKGMTPGKCELTATVPADCTFFVNEQQLKQTGTTRTMTSPLLAPGKTHTYEVRVAGTFGGKTYDLSKAVELTPGGLVQIVVATSVQTTATKGSTFASAKWLAIEPDPAARGTTIANLIKLTNTSNPILRGDWFANYSVWGQAYYNLIGLDLKDNPVEADRAKTPKVYLEKDFDKLFGFNFEATREDIVAAIADTKLVTLHNRILQRFSTTKGITGGYFWRSQDSDTGIDEEDYMSNIATFDTPRRKVQEIIASGRNGIDFYAITDDKGRLLTAAAAEVAHHSTAMPTRLRDWQIYNARNCMLCHAGGMQPIQCKVRNLLQGNISLFITDRTTKNRTLSRTIIEAFEPPLQPILDLDSAKYNAAVLAACGRTGKDIGAAFELMAWGYYDQPISLERMAWDAGVSSDTLMTILKSGINLNYQLVGVLQTPPELSAVLPWERGGYAALMQCLISYQPKR